MSLNDMSTLDNGGAALQRLIEGRKRAGLGQENEGAPCKDCFLGKGGGLFIGLRKLSAGGNATVSLSRNLFRSNSALLGGITICCFWILNADCLGACYFDTPRSDSLHAFHRWCTEEKRQTQLCSFVQYNELRLENNHAELAGGAFFMSGSEDPYSFCKETMKATDSAHNQTSGSCFKLTGNSVTVRILHFSFSWLSMLVASVQSSGYGANFATDAASLHWKNVHSDLRHLRGGKKLSIRRPPESETPNVVLAEVRDALNQTITTGVDSSKS